MLETDALDALLRDVRTLTPRHFAAMEVAELDAERIDGLVADASAKRGQPFFARGAVDSVRTRRRTANGEIETIGRLRLDDDSYCYFLVLDAPESTEELGGYLRVDGLFLKVFSDEDELNPGEWIEAPLIVGPSAVRSHRPFGEVGSVTEPHQGIYGRVPDAILTPADGGEPRIVRETPFDARWHLMAYARDLPEGAIDWEAAPELDSRILTSFMEEPAEWRAQPVRIPISKIQDARVKLAGENPARIERYTSGWIGHSNWNNVVYFESPVVDYDIELSDFAYGQGFFLHNFAYDSVRNTLRVVPFLVLTSLTRFHPEEDPIWSRVAMWSVWITLGLSALFSVLVLFDRRRSKALQDELLRRRRVRRQRGPRPAPSPQES